MSSSSKPIKKSAPQFGQGWKKANQTLDGSDFAFEADAKCRASRGRITSDSSFCYDQRDKMPSLNRTIGGYAASTGGSNGVKHRSGSWNANRSFGGAGNANKSFSGAENNYFHPDPSASNVVDKRHGGRIGSDTSAYSNNEVGNKNRGFTDFNKSFGRSNVDRDGHHSSRHENNGGLYSEGAMNGFSGNGCGKPFPTKDIRQAYVDKPSNQMSSASGRNRLGSDSSYKSTHSGNFDRNNSVKAVDAHKRGDTQSQRVGRKYSYGEHESFSQNSRNRFGSDTGSYKKSEHHYSEISNDGVDTFDANKSYSGSDFRQNHFHAEVPTHQMTAATTKNPIRFSSDSSCRSALSYTKGTNNYAEESFQESSLDVSFVKRSRSKSQRGGRKSSSGRNDSYGGGDGNKTFHGSESHRMDTFAHPEPSQRKSDKGRNRSFYSSQTDSYEGYVTGRDQFSDCDEVFESEPTMDMSFGGKGSYSGMDQQALGSSHSRARSQDARNSSYVSVDDRHVDEQIPDKHRSSRMFSDLACARPPLPRGGQRVDLNQTVDSMNFGSTGVKSSKKGAFKNGKNEIIPVHHRQAKGRVLSGSDFANKTFHSDEIRSASTHHNNSSSGRGTMDSSATGSTVAQKEEVKWTQSSNSFAANPYVSAVSKDQSMSSLGDHSDKDRSKDLATDVGLNNQNGEYGFEYSDQLASEIADMEAAAARSVSYRKSHATDGGEVFVTQKNTSFLKNLVSGIGCTFANLSNRTELAILINTGYDVEAPKDGKLALRFVPDAFPCKIFGRPKKTLRGPKKSKWSSVEIPDHIPTFRKSYTDLNRTFAGFNAAPLYDTDLQDDLDWTVGNIESNDGWGFDTPTEDLTLVDECYAMPESYDLNDTLPLMIGHNPTDLIKDFVSYRRCYSMPSLPTSLQDYVEQELSSNVFNEDQEYQYVDSMKHWPTSIVMDDYSVGLEDDAGVFIVHSGFVEQMPTLVVMRNGITFFNSDHSVNPSGHPKLQPMPHNFVFDLIPFTDSIKDGQVMAGEYFYLAKTDKEYDLVTKGYANRMVRFTNCGKGKSHVNVDIPTAVSKNVKSFSVFTDSATPFTSTSQ